MNCVRKSLGCTRLAVGFAAAGCAIALIGANAAAFVNPPHTQFGTRALLLIAAAPAEPEDFRMGDYRSPVPETLRGATVLGTEQALELWDTKGAHFIDVLPQPPRPAGLPEDTVWRPPKRRNIPGSTWLVNVGFGKLNPELEVYFKSNLWKISGGDREAPLVFYCLAKCWMSWNAAKRALGYGYSTVYWYPDGTDGWAIAGGSLEDSEPVPPAE
jgi:PQQ-dependent catabolism-associated CXXCW motif protein